MAGKNDEMDVLFDNGQSAEIDASDLKRQKRIDAEMAAYDEGVYEVDGEELPPADPSMDDDEFNAVIAKAIAAAEDYTDTELSPDREEALRYYRGEKFGNESPDLSGVVMTEVRDTILGVMPALLRIFCGTGNAVEFINSQGAPSELAKFQTAYINHIIQSDNPGFTIMNSVFKDALRSRTGILTWWHEEREIVEDEILTGLDEQAYSLLLLEGQEPADNREYLDYDVEVLAETPDTTADDESPDLLGEAQMPIMTGDPEIDMQMAPPEPQSFIRDVRVRKVYMVRKHRVAAVPPEEFIFTPIASDDLDEHTLVGRRQMKTIGDLVALGHSEEDIREAIGGAGSAPSSTALGLNSERAERVEGVTDRLFDNGFSEFDPASEYIKYCVVYALIDRDGDGIPERRRITTVGDDNVVIADEMVPNFVPFAVLCPDPEPHSLVGYSLADQTLDIQEVKSEMVRGVLDSLAESVFGQTAIEEGAVNIDDALSNARNQLIRVKRQGAIQRLSKPFTGMNALPVMEYIDNIKARRTGITMSPSGLSADTLQSTSTEAVEQVVDASQERTEMIARIFAETGVKRLMRGLLHQVVRYQDKKRWIVIQGHPVEIDPRTFVADLDLSVTVGTGRGNAAKRIAGLSFVAAQQKELVAAYGWDQPFVKPHHISNVMEDLIREQGFADVSRYMVLVGVEDGEAFVKQAQAAAAEAAKKPTPEELVAEVQNRKTDTDAQVKMAQDQTRRLEISARDANEKERLDQDFYLKAAELLGKFGIEVSEQEMRAKMDEDRAAENMASSARAEATAAAAPPAPSKP